ncbi:Hypothetical predicted protein [Olea europaea subsp. europaea]|uniref:Uncharacterized protein n=1 Tax=Olea europaea subsp. europaea TaxID=158383 RepID=A0A8S0TSP3_OLEEU|nr:Hypothetical predicted protein [Olea europaea subsp. europaea]
MGTSFSLPTPVPMRLAPNDGSLVFLIDSKQFNDSSHGNAKQESVPSMHSGFVYANESGCFPCDDGSDGMSVKEEQEEAKDMPKLVPVNDFGSALSNGIQIGFSLNKDPVITDEHRDSGVLFYEPPRFPSSDIPFFSCDLIHSGAYMQQEYSPLGIHQLMISSMTPFKLWDSPSRDNSPDAVLKNAAKTFTGTPSILKKRHRELGSPWSEMRNEKKFESTDAAETVKELNGIIVEHDTNDLLFFSPDRFGIRSDRAIGLSAKAHGNKFSRRLDAPSKHVAILSSPEIPCLSVVCSPRMCAINDGTKLGLTSLQSSNSLESKDESSSSGVHIDNKNTQVTAAPYFSWKSPWFINSFLAGPRVGTDITIEDIGNFMSPGDQCYDAIGTLFSLDLNVLMERRILDFSECGTPRKETGNFSSNISFSSPSSYLLKSCRVQAGARMHMKDTKSRTLVAFSTDLLLLLAPTQIQAFVYDYALL